MIFATMGHVWVGINERRSNLSCLVTDLIEASFAYYGFRKPCGVDPAVGEKLRSAGRDLPSTVDRSDIPDL